MVQQEAGSQKETMQEGHDTPAVPLKTTGRCNEHSMSAGCVIKLNTGFMSVKSPITPV